jgi:hypothetical protein
MADSPGGRDPGLDPRGDRGLRGVAEVFQSLLRRGIITRVSQGEWALGGATAESAMWSLLLSPGGEEADPAGTAADEGANAYLLSVLQSLQPPDPFQDGEGRMYVNPGVIASSGGGDNYYLAIRRGAREYRIGTYDAGGEMLFGRGDVANQLRFIPATTHVEVKPGAGYLYLYGVTPTPGMVISPYLAGGAGVLQFGRRTSDNNAAVGVAAEFWPITGQTTPLIATVAPGGGTGGASPVKYRLCVDLDGNLLWKYESSTTNARDRAYHTVAWADSTDATRSGRTTMGVYYTSTAQEYLRASATSAGVQLTLGNDANFAGLVVNEGGADADVRFEGDTATHLLVLDAGANQVQVGTTSAGAIATFSANQVEVNGGGLSTVVFRVQGDTEASLLATDPATDRVGVGTDSPAARLHVQADAVGDEVLRLETVATLDDPNYKVYQGRVTTADASSAVLYSFSPAADRTYLVEARVVARRTGGAAGTADDGAVYVKSCMVTTKAGTPTINATATVVEQEDQAGWDVTFGVIVGGVFRVNVTGAADNNVTWHGTVVVQDVSA